MTRLAAEIAVTEARRWIGTPFGFYMATPGLGVSCEALIFAAGWRAGVLPMTQDEFDARFGDHGRLPNGHRFREFLEAFFVPVVDGDEVRQADIAWLSWTRPEVFARKRLQPFGTHLGLITLDLGSPYLIHSDAAHGVVEVGFRGEWATRLVSRWRFPGLA